MSTTVVITMIICATVIALVAIICNHCFEKKIAIPEANCVMSKKIIKLHRNYIAGILGFAIIMLITAKYGGPNNAIFEYLSFGSTVTSLVLSILAIFVTVQSSSDLYKQFTRIDSATDTINNVSKQIEGTLSAIKNAEAKLTSTSIGISSQMENFVDQIDEKIKTRIKETEDNLKKQLAQYQTSSTSITKSLSKRENNDVDANNKEFFLEITSANGLMALYACALSLDKKTMFELSQLFKGNEAYTFGFLIASLSAKYVHFTNDANNNQITCSTIQFTVEEILNVIKSRISQLNLGSEYIDRINAINEYFGISPLTLKVE